MKSRLPSACVWLGAVLIAVASGLFWYIILTPDLPLRDYTVATIALFTAGVLLLALTPLVASARASASASTRGMRPDRAEVPSGGGKLVAKLLIWVILAAYVLIALLR